MVGLGDIHNCSLYLLWNDNRLLGLDRSTIILDSPSPEAYSSFSKWYCCPFCCLGKTTTIKKKTPPKKHIGVILDFSFSLVSSTTRPIYPSSSPSDYIFQIYFKCDCFLATLAQAKALFHSGLPKHNCSFLWDESCLWVRGGKESNVRKGMIYQSERWDCLLAVPISSVSLKKS